MLENPRIPLEIAIPLRNRNFAFLWAGQTVSSFGDYVLAVALPIWVYQLTGSATALGATAAFETIPIFLFGLLSGVVADRYNRKWIMIIADMLRGSLICTLLLVQTANHLPLLYAVAFLNASVSRFSVPARSALIPNIVKEDMLSTANALSSTTNTMIMLLAPTLGGGIVGILGPRVAVLIDAISFFLSAMAIAPVATPFSGIGKQAKPTPRIILQDIIDGFGYLRRNYLILALIVIGIIFKAGQSALSVLIVVFITEVLSVAPSTLGVAVSAMALGMLIGSFAIGNRQQQPMPTSLITIGMFVIGFSVLVWTNIADFYVFIFLLMIRGVGTAAIAIGNQTLYQTAVADEFRGRVTSTSSAVSSIIAVISLALAGRLADLIGVQKTFDLCGIAILMAGLYSYVAFKKSR